MDSAHLEGVFALLLTPFTASGEIDWPTYDRYVDWQLSQGPNGLFASCGSSELAHLTAEERIALTRRAVEHASGTPVVAVANATPLSDAQHAQAVARHAEELARMADTGVSAVVLIPPTGMGTNQERLGDYFAELADGSPVPVVLYEIPSSKPKDIAPATYGRLVAETKVCGIKDTSGTAAGSRAKIEAAPRGILYQAVAPFLLDTLRSGGTGAMVIASTAACRLVADLWSAARGDPGGDQGPSHTAEALQDRVTYLNAVLELGYVATAKYLVSLNGIPMGPYCRTGSSLSPMAAKSVEIWHAGAAGDPATTAV